MHVLVALLLVGGFSQIDPHFQWEEMPSSDLGQVIEQCEESYGSYDRIKREPYLCRLIGWRANVHRLEKLMGGVITPKSYVDLMHKTEQMVHTQSADVDYVSYYDVCDGQNFLEVAQLAESVGAHEDAKRWWLMAAWQEEEDLMCEGEPYFGAVDFGFSHAAYLKAGEKKAALCAAIGAATQFMEAFTDGWGNTHHCMMSFDSRQAKENFKECINEQRPGHIEHLIASIGWFLVAGEMYTSDGC